MRLAPMLLLLATLAGCAIRPSPPPGCEGALVPINPPAAAAPQGRGP